MLDTCRQMGDSRGARDQFLDPISMDAGPIRCVDLRSSMDLSWAVEDPVLMYEVGRPVGQVGSHSNKSGRVRLVG